MGNDTVVSVAIRNQAVAAVVIRAGELVYIKRASTRHYSPADMVKLLSQLCQDYAADCVVAEPGTPFAEELSEGPGYISIKEAKRMLIGKQTATHSELFTNLAQILPILRRFMPLRLDTRSIAGSSWRDRVVPIAVTIGLAWMVSEQAISNEYEQTKRQNNKG